MHSEHRVIRPQVQFAGTSRKGASHRCVTRRSLPAGRSLEAGEAHHAAAWTAGRPARTAQALLPTHSSACEKLLPLQPLRKTPRPGRMLHRG